MLSTRNQDSFNQAKPQKRSPQNRSTIVKEGSQDILMLIRRQSKKVISFYHMKVGPLCQNYAKLVIPPTAYSDVSSGDNLHFKKICSVFLSRLTSVILEHLVEISLQQLTDDGGLMFSMTQWKCVSCHPGSLPSAVYGLQSNIQWCP